MYKDSQWWNTVQHQRLVDTYLKDSPIELNWEMHDTQQVKDNKLIFGAWAGPLRCITHVIHEMCHLVEIDDARILEEGWGLRMPQVYIPGRYSRLAAVPATYQPSLRETRVAALQYHVQRYIGIPTTFRSVINSFQFLPDWCNIPHGIDLDSNDYSYKDIDEARYQFLQNYLIQCMEGKYTLDFFHQEWKRKNQLLHESSKAKT